MREEVINRMAQMWNVDRDALFDAYVGCMEVIANKLPTHPACRTLHVATILTASYLDAHGKEYGGDAQRAAFVAHANNVGVLLLDQ